MTANAISILCVDDDPICVDHLRTELAKVRGNFSVFYSLSPQAALAAQRQNPAQIVISDLRMGALTGIELISDMRAFAPETLYILLSGQADLRAALAALNELKVFRFLEKPASREELQLTLDLAVTELNLKRLRSISTVCHSTMNTLQNGIIFLNERLQITYSNDEAKKILRASRVFEFGPDGILKSASPRETKDFQEFMRALAHGDVRDDQKSIFRFERMDSPIPVTMSVVFHPKTESAAAFYSAMIADPSATRTNVAAIATALNILPSEAKVVCGIVDGLSLEEAASLASVSVHTARSYLKSVFQKTGVSRQAELVRLALLTAA